MNRPINLEQRVLRLSRRECNRDPDPPRAQRIVGLLASMPNSRPASVSRLPRCFSVGHKPSCAKQISSNPPARNSLIKSRLCECEKFQLNCRSAQAGARSTGQPNFTVIIAISEIHSQLILPFFVRAIHTTFPFSRGNAGMEVSVSACSGPMAVSKLLLCPSEQALPIL